MRKAIVDRLPEGPAYFPEDYVTDQPERFLAAELVREKVLLATRQEVPHSVSVTVDKWEETPRLTRIYATIRVERDGQKAIVIGSKGAMLKSIGTLAREEMEKIFGVKIYLDLHVRVQPGWRETVVYRRFLPDMIVMNAMPLARLDGARGRPGPEVADVRGLFVAGDWVGSQGLLADASLASAKCAADLIAARKPSNLAVAV